MAESALPTGFDNRPHAALLRPPRASDGRAVHELIANCPPLDANSLYCNLLQCSHFAPTCCVAELTERVVGFVSAYRHPQQPEVLFIWQVAVAASARGAGLARTMLGELLGRSACAGVMTLQTTITPSNHASWSLFRAFARELNAPLSSTPCFDRLIHLDGQHESELLVSIGPFATRVARPFSRIRRTA